MLVVIFLLASIGSVLPDLHSTQSGEETAVPTGGNLRGTSVINLEEWKSFTIRSVYSVYLWPEGYSWLAMIVIKKFFDRHIFRK